MRGTGFRRGFVLGCCFGATLGVAAFALLPLAAFVVASLAIGIWLVRKVNTELDGAYGRLLAD